MARTLTFARPGRGRDWTQGGIIRNLFALSWPMIITNSLNLLGPTIDMIWVGKLGANSVAGVGIAGMVVMLVNSAANGLFIGLQAMVARFVGQGDNRGAVHVARQAFLVSGAFALFIGILGVLFATTILRLIGMDEDVIRQGAPYLRVQFLGMITMSFQQMATSTMVASGDTIMPMWISVLYRLFHVVLCPFMVFGWWLFPRMGATGAAITSVVSTGLAASLGLAFLFSGQSRLKLDMKGFKVDLKIIWRIIKIGIPASFTNMERSLGQFIFMYLVAKFGTLAVAAQTVGQSVDGILQMPAMAFGQAAGVLAAQNLGAGKPERSVKAAWFAFGIYTGSMVLASLAIWFWAENIAGLYAHTADLQRLAGTYLRIQIASYLMFGFIVVIMTCMNNVGDTMPVMLATLVTMWGIQVPLAYFLPKITNLGVTGIWWALAIGVVMRGGFYGVYFPTGRWMRKKV